MRHNAATPLKFSTLSPALIDLDGPRPCVVCPSCGTWRVLHRGMIPAHLVADHAGSALCPSTGQRYVRDLSPAEWSARRTVAARHAARVRPVYARSCTRPKPQPAAPVPVHRPVPARAA